MSVASSFRFDPTYQRWTTWDAASGQWRWATEAESQQAQQPGAAAGVVNPTPSTPAGELADSALMRSIAALGPVAGQTEETVLPGHTPSWANPAPGAAPGTTAPPPAATTPPPATTTPSGPVALTHGGWRPMSELEASYYDKQDPQSAYRQMLAFFGNPNSAQSRYAQSQYSNVHSQFDAAAALAEQNGGELLFPDYLTNDVYKRLQDNYNQQGYDQRGVNPTPLSAGAIKW